MSTEEERPADLPPEKPSHRSISLGRREKGHYTVTNVRGGTIPVSSGANADFTPVELLLAGIAGCTSVDVDFLTARRAEPESFVVEVEAEKVSANGATTSRTSLSSSGLATHRVRAVTRPGRSCPTSSGSRTTGCAP